MDTKEIIKYAAIAGGVYLVYIYVIKPATQPATPTNPSANPTGVMPTNTPLSIPPLPTPKPPVVPTPPAPTPPTVNATFDSPDYGTAPWMTRVAAAMKAAANGAVANNLDNWSWFYQNPVNGSSISGALMEGIINNAGGDRSTQISADSFISALVSAKASGISGLFSGLRGFGLGVM